MQNYQLSMAYLRAFIGVILITLSLYATISFLSQGFSGLAFISVAVFCLSTEAIKVLFSGDISYYLALKMPEKALFSFSIVFVLFCLSIGAETWLLSNGSLKESATLQSTSTRTDSLNAQINDKKTQLAQCNPSHLTKCVNPRTNELQSLQAEFDKIQAAESSHAEILANQKFWQQIATATGSSPENLQLGLNILRSFLAELIGLVCLGQFSAYKRLQAMPKPVYADALPDNNAALIENMKLLKEIQDLKAELGKKQ